MVMLAKLRLRRPRLKTRSSLLKIKKMR